MNSYAMTWDVGILGTCALLLAYSLLIRKHKALATLVSVYISYMVTSGWGDRVAAFFTGDRVAFNSVWIKANLSPFTVKSGLLIIVAILLSSFLKLGGKRGRYSVPEVVIYSVCAVMIGVLGMVAFMPADVLAHTLATSKIIHILYNWRDWLPLLPVVAMVFFGMYGNDEL